MTDQRAIAAVDDGKLTSMVPSDVVTRLKRATCAVVRFEQPIEDLFPEGLRPGARVERFDPKVAGTGFLVRSNLIATNRHILEHLQKDWNDQGHIRNWYMEFTYPNEAGGWGQTYRRPALVVAFVDPLGGTLDAGLIQCTDNGGGATPVDFGELTDIVVGQGVAMCGFPLGRELLTGLPGAWRFGPLVHEGIISGIAPFDAGDPRNYTAFLTDMNTGKGNSGSPVFHPESGRVIGLHYCGEPGTFGGVVPLDAKRVTSWVDFHVRVRAGTVRAGTVRITGGGDVVIAD